ncbi:ABC transporter ATP-binding protein [Sulfurimonas sp. MAG313]|nr:ABC transporter ATP-binding protein [Sulfurimonas sp. MAG313]MDF1880352.1 ABC transporter ATP-binding protein [Sulfurimonas sp. MAG313]
MSIKRKVIFNAYKVIKEDKKNISYLLYYSMIKSILVLSIPLASSFIINSVLSHATISVFVLGLTVVIIFMFITFLSILQEYIVEKFQQKIFVKTGIRIAELAINLKKETQSAKNEVTRYMNYFFDIMSIQKLFPIVLLDGVGLVIKIVVSLLLLLAFDPLLFGSAIIVLFIYLVFLILLGYNGVKYAINRSDMKHQSIYLLQHIPYLDAPKDETLHAYDVQLNAYIEARQKSFSVIIRQLALTFFMEGLILSGFLILGGYLVVNGTLPIGEFVAAEIIIVSIIYSLKVFVKQIDAIYEMIEGFYKLDKLETSLTEKMNNDV